MLHSDFANFFFMRHYFLMAKTVGDLTGLFLAHLDESFNKASWLPTLPWALLPGLWSMPLTAA